MDENLTMPIEPALTDEEIAAIEQQRAEAEEARLAPYRQAKEQREDSAAIIAEHDDLLADMLFELTMSKFGEEV